jgi:hypothetical protein
VTRKLYRPGSIPVFGSTEGTGHASATGDYPFQGLDLDTEPYCWGWLYAARYSAAVAFMLGGRPVMSGLSSGEHKYHGRRTPLGTPLCLAVRRGHDMLASPCGECGRNISVCACWRGGTADSHENAQEAN